MKKIALLVIVALTVMNVSAQKFGVKAGLNLSNYYGSNANGFEVGAGFNVGGLFELPIATNFYLQPELQLSLKRVNVKVFSASYNPYYLVLPVKAMYKLNLGAGNLTFAAGPYVAYGIGGKSKATYEDVEVSINMFSDEVGAKRFDAGLTGAIGYELKSGLFFSLESQTGFTKVYDSSVHTSCLSLNAGFKF